MIGIHLKDVRTTIRNALDIPELERIAKSLRATFTLEFNTPENRWYASVIMNKGRRYKWCANSRDKNKAVRIIKNALEKEVETRTIVGPL